MLFIKHYVLYLIHLKSMYDSTNFKTPHFNHNIFD